VNSIVGILDMMKKGRGPEGKKLSSKPSFLSTCALRADALLDSPIGRISLIETDDSRLFFLNLERLCSEFMFPFVFSQNSASSRVYCHPERPEAATNQCRNISLYGTLALILQGVALAPWLSNYLMFLISLFVPYLGPPKVSVLSAFFVLTPRHQELVYCKNPTLSTS